MQILIKDIGTKDWALFFQELSNIVGEHCYSFEIIDSDSKSDFEPLIIPTLTGDLENDLQIIYKNGKPHGIRDRSGYLLFFPEKSRYDNQPERYKQEMYQQNLLAEYLLHQLSKCPA
ncbi:MAG: hypothetical protein JEZ01_20510 [Labilibaculum sp.]|nr:hypothetical protein [Labilibaculum sp.]MBI9060162.1 hypothetical protein [Labilibaculum sp.]